MKPNRNGIRLAQANAPIRKELKHEGKLWFVVDEESINALSFQYPNSYLGILETWRKALYNQTLYKVYGGNCVSVVGIYVDNGNPMFMFFDGIMKDGAIVLESASNYHPSPADWKFVKKDSRKLNK